MVLNISAASRRGGRNSLGHQPQNQPKKRLVHEYIKYRSLFVLFIPVIAYFIIFRYMPMYGILMAFEDYNPMKGILRSHWVGLSVFKDMFSGLYFWPVFRNTLIISFLKLLFGFPAPIILCLLLNEVRNASYKKVVQTLTYLPHFVSWVVLAGILIQLLSPSTGAVNYIIRFFGGKAIYFVADTHWFRTVLVSSSIWREIGWQSIVYLAAVTSIDPELYDVAELDGAGRLRRVWNITIPSILPIVVIMFIFAVGNIMNDDFDQVYNLLNAKVMSVGDVISTYTYRVGLQQMDYSYATAVGLFKNIIAVILVTLTNALARRINGNSLW